MSEIVITHFLWLFVCVCMSSANSSNVWGYPGEGYYVEVEIGSPPQKLNVLLDTGSANLAVAAAPLPNIEAYFHSNLSRTFQNRNQSVSVTYTQGTWQGVLGSDLVHLPNVHATQVRCDVALIQESEDFFSKSSKWQGILGLGYPVLAQPRGSATSWLAALPPPSAFSLRLGCLSGVNTSQVYGFLEVLHSPIPKSPYRAVVIREWFYEVIVTGAWIDNVPIDVPCQEFNNDKSIVDSGTTNLRLPHKVFQETIRIFNTSVRAQGINISEAFWSLESVVCFDEKPQTIFPSLALGLARDDGQYFKVVLGPESYLRMDRGSNSHTNCRQLALEPSDTGTVLGLVFLEGLKVIFNQENRSVSFSNSSCGPAVLLEGPFSTEDDLLNCAYKDDVPSALTAITVTMGAFLSVAAVVVAYLACSRFCPQYICPVKTQWPHRSRSRRELLPGSSDVDLTTAT